MKRLLLFAAMLLMVLVDWFAAEYYRPTIRYEMKKG